MVGCWIGGGRHTGGAFDDLAVGKLDKITGLLCDR